MHTNINIDRRIHKYNAAAYKYMKAYSLVRRFRHYVRSVKNT